MYNKNDINKIIFYIDKDARYPTNDSRNHTKPKTTPAFVYAFDSYWNDYDTYNLFDVYFYEDLNTCTHIGKARFIETNQKEKAYKITDFLQNEYKELPKNLVSLGVDKTYYESFFTLFHLEAEPLLIRLRDCAICQNAYISAKNNYWWHSSLLRSYDSERSLREAISIIHGKDINNLYKFIYYYKTEYTNKEKEISFLFDEQNKFFPRRIYALIGKNGVGKTQLLSALPFAILERKTALFSNNEIPPFSKIITVSTSYYDIYPRPKSNEVCEYVYCGILDENNNVLSMGQQKEIIQENCEYLISNSGKYFKIGEDFLEIEYKTLGQVTKELLLLLFKNIDIENVFFKPGTLILNIENILDIFVNKMSSGERILLYNIFNILAKISFNSLLFFDEPETHLHPNAITELISGLMFILETFQSFAIIATHSPLVIRELKSDSVLIMKRYEDELHVSKIGYESLGASINKLTNDIFKNKETEPYYIKKINNMHEKGKTSEEIIRSIESDEDYQIDLRTFMYIKSLDETKK